jgi:hypothetical protein
MSHVRRTAPAPRRGRSAPRSGGGTRWGDALVELRVANDWKDLISGRVFAHEKALIRGWLAGTFQLEAYQLIAQVQNVFGRKRHLPI